MYRLTLEKFHKLDVGMEVHDMHYGLDALKLESPLRATNHVTMRASGGSQFIMRATGESYCNKMATVVKAGMTPYGFAVTLAYSYDDRMFGMFEISEGNENRGDI